MLRQTVNALGLSRPHPAEIAQEFYRSFFEHLACLLGNDYKRIIDICVGLYHEVAAEKAHLYPGIAETLEPLKEREYRLAIISDKQHASGEAVPEQAGAKGLPDRALLLYDGQPYKPDPTGLRAVMATLRGYQLIAASTAASCCSSAW